MKAVAIDSKIISNGKWSIMKPMKFLSRLLTLILVYGLMISCNPGTKQDEREDFSTTRDHLLSMSEPEFKISLAQWSLHRTFFGFEAQDWSKLGGILQEDPDAIIQGEDPMKFPEMAAGYGIHSIELLTHSISARSTMKPTGPHSNRNARMPE